mgnify:CR=1 FL=1
MIETSVDMIMEEWEGLMTSVDMIMEEWEGLMTTLEKATLYVKRFQSRKLISNSLKLPLKIFQLKLKEKKKNILVSAGDLVANFL